MRLGAHPDCIGDPSCGVFAEKLYQQLSTGAYDFPASVVRLDSVEEHLATHRTMRKRANRAERLGYSAGPIDRSEFVEDIHRINTSAVERQGKPMSAGYLERPSFQTLPDYPCPRHRIDEWGVLTGEILVAYLVLYISGELAMVSQILGDRSYEKDDINFLLVREAFAWTVDFAGPVTAFYNRHDSGTEGLRSFKERLGFRPERVEWLL